MWNGIRATDVHCLPSRLLNPSAREDRGHTKLSPPLVWGVLWGVGPLPVTRPPPAQASQLSESKA